MAAQIDHRLRMLRSVSARSLVSYNRQIEAANERGAPLTWQSTPGDDSDLPFLSRIVVVVDAIDELSDGSAWSEEILDIVRRGAAVGLHLVVVSRSFSAKVLEQLLRQGTVARLCLQVPTARESQALLNVEGADLLGMNGDAYLLPSNGAPTRLHLPLVVEEEVGAVGEHWRSQGEPLNFAFPSPVRSAVGTATEADDELYARALEIVRTQGRASTSYVQRTLRIGYNSAAKLIDRMEREGHVGAPDAVGRREVLSASRRAVPREADNEAPKGRSWLPWRR